MAKIQIKRGLQKNITDLVLAEGEMAVALDTGNVYIGTTAGTTWINPPGGNADTAVALKTPREFSIKGDGTAEPVAFDGTGNVALALALATMAGLTPGTYTKLTVDTKGRVTAGTQIAVEDLPGGIPAGKLADGIPAGKITGLGAAAALDTGTAPGRVVTVGSDGKIAEGLLPPLAITDTFEAASEAAMLALDAQRGDVCIRSDENKSYILMATPATTLDNWKWLRTPDCKVLSVNGKSGAVVLGPADIGAEPALSGAAEKETVVDGDALILRDSAAGSATRTLTFGHLKEALKGYFDGLYNKYVHPAHTARAAGLYKVTVDAQGHVSDASAVVKADITALGIPAQDTQYTLPAATATVRGGVRVGDGLALSGDTLNLGDVDGGAF